MSKNHLSGKRISVNVMFIVFGILALTQAGCDQNSLGSNSSTSRSTSTQKNSSSERYTVDVTDENFEQVVMENDKLVLLDFWASWCGPCRVIAPHLERLAEVYDGEIVVGKINVDEQQRLASLFEIDAIPALVYFKDGEVVERTAGVKSFKQLKQQIDALAD